MKTRNLLKLMAILIAVVGINIAGCKKDKTTPASTSPDPSSLSQLAQDDNQVQASDNEIMNDGNTALSSNSSKSMDTTAINSCTISVDTVGTNLVITLVYNGFNTAHSFSRTGTVIITKPLGSHWVNAGCAVTFNYVNLAITKISTGKQFIFNGTRTWTNVSGGLIINLGSTTTPTTSVTHQITGAMQITFENGTQRTWTIYRQRVWSGKWPNALVMSASGFGTSGIYNDCVEFGTNRNGEAFYTQIHPSTPVVFNEGCLWLPISGSLTHSIPNVPKSATITYGYSYNAGTNSYQLATSGTCADAYELAWTWKTYTGTLYGIL
jgi:hypothetical protein